MATIYIRWTVTVSGETPKTDSNNTASTDWTPWTGDNRFNIDTSELTQGSATIKLEVKGHGQYKNVYIYQGATDHIHTQPKDDLVEFNRVTYTKHWEKDFYLQEDNVYCGMHVQAL